LSWKIKFRQYIMCETYDRKIKQGMNISIWLLRILEKLVTIFPVTLWQATRYLWVYHKWINKLKPIFTLTEFGPKIKGYINRRNYFHQRSQNKGVVLSRIRFNIHLEDSLNVWHRKCYGIGITDRNRTDHSLLYRQPNNIFIQWRRCEIYDAEFIRGL
jgi:hypothetical protein